MALTYVGYSDLPLRSHLKSKVNLKWSTVYPFDVLSQIGQKLWQIFAIIRSMQCNKNISCILINIFTMDKDQCIQSIIMWVSSPCLMRVTNP